MRVRAAAQLARVVANRHDAYLLAVLLTEHHDRTHLPGAIHRHDLPVHGQIIHAAVVDDVEHALELLRADWPRVVEVETQLVWADIRALLAGALAEDILQRAVEQVRRGVVAARLVAAQRIDFSARELANIDFAFL